MPLTRALLAPLGQAAGAADGGKANASWAELRRARQAHDEPRAAWVRAPRAFLPGYRSPCWVQCPSDGCRFFCLPYFYVIGVMKCGTSELFAKIAWHPNVTARVTPNLGMSEKMRKEPHYWILSGAPRNTSLRPYMRMLAADLAYIYDHPGAITGEASVSLMAGGPYVPRPNLPELLQALHSGTRYLVILRNPVDRAYSQFNYRATHGSAQDFHDECVRDLARIRRECYRQHNLTRLLTPAEYPVRCAGGLVSQGLYAHHLVPWLRALPAGALLVIAFRDLVRPDRQRSLMESVYRHLGLSTDLGESFWQKLVGKPLNRNGGPRPPPMLPATREMLRAFYSSQNALLAQLLDDPRYLDWNNP